jgi:hypothetical protein
MYRVLFPHLRVQIGSKFTIFYTNSVLFQKKKGGSESVLQVLEGGAFGQGLWGHSSQHGDSCHPT